MFSLRDLSFFLVSTICFFLLLIVFNFFGLKQSLNLFVAAFIYGIANSLYVLYYCKIKQYLILVAAFFLLILSVGNSHEILLIYSGSVLAFALIQIKVLLRKS